MPDPITSTPDVSIIIPAYNAAGTLRETLASVQKQTHPSWEAIVVDDGSSDDTPAIAQQLAASDSRIKFARSDHGGVSRARNLGIERAVAEWILFLDADDQIDSRYLEKLLDVAKADPTIDAVSTGNVRINPAGEKMWETIPKVTGDLFPLMARTCYFAMHACIIKRALVQELGGFDPSLRTCEDWDFWQRLARRGTKFANVPEPLALYCVRPTSATADARSMLIDAITVMARGHAPDARVAHALPQWADGMPAAQLPSARLMWLCWSAALMIGQGRDPRALLDLVNDDRDPDFDPDSVANQLFQAVLLPQCNTPQAWPSLWPKVEPAIERFLTAMEAQTGARHLALLARRALIRMICNAWRGAESITIGHAIAQRIEVTQPIADVRAAPGVERLFARIEASGQHLGNIELPVCDGLVSSRVIADAIAAQHAWTLLRLFFEQTIFPTLKLREAHDGLSIVRGANVLVSGVKANGDDLWPQVHEQIGWLLLLQELWGEPTRPKQWFYEANVHSPANAVQASGPWQVVETSAPLPAFQTSEAKLHIAACVGGMTLCEVIVESRGGRVEAGAIRSAITTAGGMELGRAIVREAIVGRAMKDGQSIRQRLAASARNRPSANRIAASDDATFAPRADQIWARDLVTREQNVLAVARWPGPASSVASRRASLPTEVIDEVRASSQPHLLFRVAPQGNTRVAYAPDLLWLPKENSAANIVSASPAPSTSTRAFDRGYFEGLFASKQNPWQYTSDYERRKYEQTLSLVPDAIGHALEIGCAEGHFTQLLAPRVKHLVAADISTIALERTRRRCASFSHIKYQPIDLMTDSLPRDQELIVCSETLYYLGSVERLQQFVHRLEESLAPGGYFLHAHPNLVVDEPDQPGFDWDMPFGARTIEQTLNSSRAFSLVEEIRTPLYRIQLYRKGAEQKPPVRRDEQAGDSVPEVAKTILWHGGKPRGQHWFDAPQTERLPILMYHRVAPTGEDSMRRWRLAPDEFRRQMEFLAQSGYRSIRFDEWRSATETRTPIDGRAVILTFDDAYLDFYEHAYPLLREFGFWAYVFVVTDRAGEVNQWDLSRAEKLPLMNWEQIRELHGQGIRFGSHTAAHPVLTALSNGEAVRELVRSRSTLARELGAEGIDAIAYPYGRSDDSIAHFAGACGYQFAVTCRNWRASFTDSMLQLPRVEVRGDKSFEDFVAAL